MELTRTSTLKTLAGHVLPWFRVRPVSGRLWLDCMYLLVIGFLHNAVLATTAGRVFYFDLMTPWLVTIFVIERLHYAAVLALVASLILETHSAAPRGLYLTAYWVLVVAIYLTRSTLSWRHVTPWLAVYVVSETWVVAFELFVSSVQAQSFALTPTHALLSTVRILTATATGMLLAQRFLGAGPAPEAD